jgi:hypothetical protein
MAIAVKDNTVVAVEIEVTEGTYVAPSADTSYVQTLSDGFEQTGAKELLERNILNGSIGKTTPLTGTRSVTGAMPVEMRANSTEGAPPEYDKLMRSAMGLRRDTVTSTIDDTDSGGTHTTTRAYLPDASAGLYDIGDIVTIEKAGAFHTSPITAKSDTPGDVYIDLLIAASGAFVDAEVIKAVATYVTADSGHPSLSVSKYVESAVLEQATGVKVTSMALENFTTGQLASWNFSYEGLDWDDTLTANPFTPAFDTALPPIILQACVFQDATQIDVNELSFSLENTLGFVTSTCSENGRISSRATERTVTGSFNPYKEDDSVEQSTKFRANTEFSIFASAFVPTGVAGEYGNVVAFYLPNCITTEKGEADQDGLLQHELSFTAGRGSAGTEEELYVSFS